MKLISEIFKYYKNNRIVIFLTIFLAYNAIGFAAMASFITYMKTENIILTRAFAVIVGTFITCGPLSIYNWKFVCQNKTDDKIKMYISIQALTILPIVIFFTLLSFGVSG